MGVAAVAGELGEGLGHEAGPQALGLRQRFHHHLEEGMAIGGGEGVGEGPVELELAVGILVIGLIRTPTQLLHAIQQSGDQRVAAHQGELVVAGFLLGVGGIGDRLSTGLHQKEFRLHTAAQLVAEGLGALLLTPQQAARALGHWLTVERQLSRHPAHLRLPGQPHQAGGIWDRHHIAIGGAEVQPGGEAGKTSTITGHRRHRRGGHQLGPLHAEQVGERDQQEAQLLFAHQAGEIGHGGAVGSGVWRLRWG